MITSEDAKQIAEKLRALSAKYRKFQKDAELGRYELGQRDGRRDAYALAARMVEGSNHKEADGEQRT